MNEGDLFPSLSILGVCGSIGSGKSYACSLLTEKLKHLNIASYHLDTDSIAHSVYSPGSQAISEIATEFGPSIIADGNVDRKALGAIVFSDPKMMRKLEQIVWPHVKELVINHLKDISQSHQQPDDPVIVVVEAAVLLDANWDENDLFDGIWIIRSSEETSIDRLVNKRGMTKEDAIKRIKSQLVRRGIGNYEDELQSGYVTSVILNEGHDLWNKLKNNLLDSSSWKKDRNPKLLNSDLEERPNSKE